jgi:hypothetical protein
MAKIEEGGSSIFVNEFLIDFDLLEERKIQYLPFDKNDKILEVVNGVPNKEDQKQPKSVILSNKIDTFIQEKSNYLKNVTNQKDSAQLTDYKVEASKNFTEKLYGLLQETRKLR